MIFFYLSLALDPSPSWDISLNDRNASSLSLDWSGFPGALNADFFIISLNQTQINQDSEHDHHDEHENKPLRLLEIVNASQTTVVISGLPAATEFIAIVYLVDTNNDIYKSGTRLVKTEESG